MANSGALERTKGSGPNLKGIINLQKAVQDGPPKRWIAGDSADLAEGGRLVVDVGGTSVGIFRVEGKLYAYLNVCMHMGGPACQGKILPRELDAIDEDGQLPSLGLTPTDAVVVAAALLRDQNLTPFDLTVWFQRVASEAKKSNSFNVAAALAQEQFAKRLAEAGSAVA